MLRRLWLPVVLLLAVLGGLAAGLSGAAARPLGPEGATPSEANIEAHTSTQNAAAHSVYLPLLAAKTPVYNHIGVQYYSDVSSSRGVDLHGQAGAKWIRYPVIWAGVERENTTPENYNWNRIDASVQAAADVGIELLMTIRGQPEWIAEHNMGPVNDINELYEFVTALVERYDGDGYQDAPVAATVRYFELYNEPDITTYHIIGAAPWGNRGDEYGELLAQLYPVVKAASPKAKLVVGGLAADWFIEDGGPFDPDFTDDLLTACQGKDCFDVWNFHYYPSTVWDAWGVGLIGKTNYFRQKLAEYGVGDKEIICTETGNNGADGEWGGDEQQSRYVVKAFVRGVVADLPIVIWYTNTDITNPNLKPGLLDTSYEPKPAYRALDTVAGMISGATYVRAMSAAETGSTDIEGYTFTKLDGHRLDVVWTEDDTRYVPDDNPVVPFYASASSLKVTDKSGQWSAVINDGDDGAVDGRVRIIVTGSPLFLEY